MKKILYSVLAIVVLLIAIVTSTFAIISNDNVGVTGISVKIDNTYASGITFSTGEEVKNLNTSLTSMIPVVNKGFYFYFNEEDEHNLSGEDLTNNVVYENLLLTSLEGEKTLKVKSITFTNTEDEIAKSLRVGIRLWDDFYVYSIDDVEFNQTFAHKLTTEVSVISLFVWFEKTDENCTAYNISQATQNIGVEVVLGV